MKPKLKYTLHSTQTLLLVLLSPPPSRESRQLQNITSHAFVPLLFLFLFSFSLLLFVVLVCCCCLHGVRERVSQIRIVDKLMSLCWSESREEIRNKEKRSTNTRHWEWKRERERAQFLFVTRDSRCVVYITLKKYNHNRLLQQNFKQKKTETKMFNACGDKALQKLLGANCKW